MRFGPWRGPVPNTWLSSQDVQTRRRRLVKHLQQLLETAKVQGLNRGLPLVLVYSAKAKALRPYQDSI